MPVRGFSREQAYLLPPSLDDWLPADHPVRYVAEFVDALAPGEWQEMGIDLGGAETGAPAYHPRVLLSVWLAGFMSGVRSSRKLEGACRDQVSFRWLTGNQVPDHNTLWRFYAAHRQGMQHLLKTTVRTAQAAGLVDLVLLAVDGTKVAGNASEHRNRDAAALEAMEQRLDAAIAELEAANDAGGDDGPPSLPRELAQTHQLRERVRVALKEVQAEHGPRQANLTDPETRIQKTRRGYLPGYNAQAAVVRVDVGPERSGGLLLTAAEVRTAQDDHQHLMPMLEASTEALGQAPEVVAADGGYYAGTALTACAERGQVVVMPDAQSVAQVTHSYHRQHFTYDAATDTYTCPHGQTLTYRRTQHRPTRPTVRIYRAEAAVCRACPAHDACTTNQHHGRSLQVNEHDRAITEHRRWMQTAHAQALLATRKSLIEPVFGILKEQQRLSRFLLRGLENVSAEWSLLAVAFNLRTLSRVWQRNQTPPAHTPDPTEKSSVTLAMAPTMAVTRLRRWVRTHSWYPLLAPTARHAPL